MYTKTMYKSRIPQQCHFCSQNIEVPDYKDAKGLLRFMSSQGKIIDPKYTKTCSKHQRKLSEAIKRSRFLALVPYTTRLRA